MAATGTGQRTGHKKFLVLAAMIFAVAMTFIDQTIVSIAVPKIQSELHLSINGVQWVVNAYLLALAAAFTFGGRLADMIGHRRMVVIGILTFAIALDSLRPHPEGVLRRRVDHQLAGGAGHRRRDHVPGRAGHRGHGVSGA